MTENKTIETDNSVFDFINGVKDETKRNDCFRILEEIKKQTGLVAKMWGPNIVGFGRYHYKYESGREGDMPLVAFSPRTNAISFYLSGKFDKREELLKKLGKHKTGKGCIYVKQLQDININVLKEMIAATIKQRQPLASKQSSSK